MKMPRPNCGRHWTTTRFSGLAWTGRSAASSRRNYNGFARTHCFTPSKMTTGSATVFFGGSLTTSPTSIWRIESGYLQWRTNDVGHDTGPTATLNERDQPPNEVVQQTAERFCTS